MCGDVTQCTPLDFACAARSDVRPPLQELFGRIICGNRGGCFSVSFVFIPLLLMRKKLGSMFRKVLNLLKLPVFL